MRKQICPIQEWDRDSKPLWRKLGIKLTSHLTTCRWLHHHIPWNKLPGTIKLDHMSLKNGDMYPCFARCGVANSFMDETDHWKQRHWKPYILMRQLPYGWNVISCIKMHEENWFLCKCAQLYGKCIQCKNDKRDVQGKWTGHTEGCSLPVEYRPMVISHRIRMFIDIIQDRVLTSISLLSRVICLNLVFDIEGRWYGMKYSSLVLIHVLTSEMLFMKSVKSRILDLNISVS